MHRKKSANLLIFYFIRDILRYFSANVKKYAESFQNIFISINWVIKKEAQKKSKLQKIAQFIFDIPIISSSRLSSTSLHLALVLMTTALFFSSLLRFHTSTYYPRHTSSTKWYYPWYKRMRERETSLTVTIYLRSSYLNLTSCFPPKERLH